MGAGVSACQYSEENLPKVTAFAEKVTSNSKSLPTKDEAKDAAFNPEGGAEEPIVVPQKYIWIQHICSPFVLYTDLNGKTLPELWDEIAGSGFTDHSPEDIQKISSQVILATLAPEIKELVESDVEENAENQAKWDVAIGTVLHRNIANASAKSDSSNPLAGSPDSVLEVDAEKWASIVYSPPVDAYPTPTTTKQAENPVAAEEEEGGQATKKQKTEDNTTVVADAAAAADPPPAEETAAVEAVESTTKSVSDFCKEWTKNCLYMPSKDECKDTAFSPEGEGGEPEEAVVVPQKYIWLNSLCVNFIQFGDLKGKTLPSLWDSAFDSGFTDYSTSELHEKAAALLESVLHPEIQALIESGTKEEENQEAWSIASGKAIYGNCAAAKEAASSDGKEVEIQFALAGSPDEAFPVADEKQWKERCVYFPSSLFAPNGKFNNDSYTKEQLGAILGREVNEDELAFEATAEGEADE